MSKMPEPVAFLVDWPDEPDLGHYFAEEQATIGRSQPLITTTQAEAYKDACVREAQQWRPIETAPQGQIALFYDADATEVRHCMFVDWMVDGAFCGNRHHTATHWAPLPAPPQ